MGPVGLLKKYVFTHQSCHSRSTFSVPRKRESITRCGGLSQIYGRSKAQSSHLLLRGTSFLVCHCEEQSDEAISRQTRGRLRNLNCSETFAQPPIFILRDL